MVIFLLKRGGDDFQGVGCEELRNKGFEEFFSAAKYILLLLNPHKFHQEKSENFLFLSPN